MGGGQSMPQQEAKHLATIDCGDGFMKAEYGCTLDIDKTPDLKVKKGVVTCEGPHSIKWQWNVTLVGADSGKINTTTTLLAADKTPVCFKLTWTDSCGTTEQYEFQLSGPGESKEEMALGDSGSSLTYMVSFRFPVAELPPVVASPCSSLPALSNDFGEMMLRGIHSDVTVTAGTKGFKLHKAVLSTRSNVFASMLDTNLLESGNNINVELDENVAEEIVNYMYTGKVKDLQSMSSELVKPAHTYELEGLEKMCLDVLASRLTIENAAETMMMADFCGSQDYNILFTKYVSENYFEVVLTEGWRRLHAENPELSLAVTTSSAEMKTSKNNSN